MTFSEQIVYGLFKPSKYKELLGLKKRRFALYVVVLLLVMGIVGMVVPNAAVIAGFGGFKSLFTEKMGKMEFDGEKLNIEKPFKMSCGSLNVLIDTDYDMVPDEKLTDDNRIYLAVGNNNIRISIPTADGWVDYVRLELKPLLPKGFNNESLVSYIPSLYLGLIFSFLFTCVGYFIKYSLFALILAFCVNSINKHMELGLPFGKVFVLCFYGESLGMLISNFNLAMGLLPAMLVSMLTVFLSINMVTAALASMKKGNQI